MNAAYVSMPRDGINRTDLCQVRNASYGGNAGAEIITSYLLAVIVYPRDIREISGHSWQRILKEFFKSFFHFTALFSRIFNIR